MKRVGLALGGGGARGLSHIPVLELLDELELRPCIIAGTSIGALVGALYASGMAGRSIRELVTRYFVTGGQGFRGAIRKRVDLLKWVGPPETELRRGGVLKPDRFLRRLLDAVSEATFEDLEIPLLVTATDFWTAEEIVFQNGELLPAIRASIAVPGVFAPLVHGSRVLVDGGLMNQVPYDHIEKKCDISIAVDVGRSRTAGRREIPSALDALLGAFDIMQATAVARKIEEHKPDIFVQPQVAGIRILDFSKADDVFEQSRPAVEKLRRDIARVVASS